MKAFPLALALSLGAAAASVASPFRVELEVETAADFRGVARLSGYALYYLCEDVDGTCLYRRRDVEVTLRAK